MLDKGRISSVTPAINIDRVSCWMWGQAEARDSIGKVRREGNCPGSETKRAPACDFRTEDSFETTETTLADCRSGGGCHRDLRRSLSSRAAISRSITFPRWTKAISGRK